MLVAVGIAFRTVGVGATVGVVSSGVGNGDMSVLNATVAVGSDMVAAGCEVDPGVGGGLFEGGRNRGGSDPNSVGSGRVFVRVRVRVAVMGGEGVGVGGTSLHDGGPFCPLL